MKKLKLNIQLFSNNNSEKITYGVDENYNKVEVNSKDEADNKYKQKVGSDYIKFPCGVAFCWGNCSSPDDFRHNTTKDVNVAFPIQFIENPKILLGNVVPNGNGVDYIKIFIPNLVTDNLKNGFKLRFRNSATASTGADYYASCNWFAVGKWKEIEEQEQSNENN